MAKNILSKSLAWRSCVKTFDKDANLPSSNASLGRGHLFAPNATSNNFTSILNRTSSQQIWATNFSTFQPSPKISSNVVIANNILEAYSARQLATSTLLCTEQCASKRSYSTTTSKGNSPEGETTKPSEVKSNILESMYGKEAESTSENSAKAGDEKSETGGEDKKEGESAFLRSQRYAKWVLLATMGVMTPVFILQRGQPKLDELGIEVEDEFSSLPVVLGYIKRSWSEIKLVRKDIVEPSSKKLLPEPLSEPYYQPPYTLVIELMDVFLRPVYDSVTGWRFKKRPGIDYFLSQVGPPMFEIVIFTKETGMTAYPLIESMDQNGYIMYRLFRDAARYKSGFSLGNILKGEVPKLDPYYQKDLRYLNRDLSKVLIVDCDSRAFEKQPENGLCLQKWDGSTSDSTLFDLAAFLRTIASSEVDDVRPVLKHYSSYSEPLEAFKLAQAKMQDMQSTQTTAKNPQLFAGATNTLSSFFRRR